MPQVSNLQLQLQPGTERKIYASWDFGSSQGSVSSSTTTRPKVGDIVKIKSGAKYYNGVSIPNWVMNSRWYVYEIYGNRAVINSSPDNSYKIMSPIHVDYISTSESTSVSTVVNNLDHFSVKWQYSTGNNVWFEGSTEDVSKDSIYNALYDMPSNAIKIKCTVKPVSTTYEYNNQSVPHWTGTNVSAEYLADVLPPKKASTPSVELNKLTLKATINDIDDEKCDQIEFEIYKGDTKFNSGIQSVVTARASYSCSVEAGFRYRVRARGINLYDGTKVYGDWSNYSPEVLTVPACVTDIDLEVQADNVVRIAWNGSETAETYEIEYTTNKLYFDSSSEVSSLIVTNTYAYISGLQEGSEWYFRVRAKNNTGESAWSDIVYKIVGTKPQPPTTWSLTSSAIIGDRIILYWVHNSEDGSRQKEANIELLINGEGSIIRVDTSEITKTEKDRIYSHEVDLSEYPDGADILWRVRTRGITDDFSDWSIQRTINVYAPPTSELHINNDNLTVDSLPLNVEVNVGPNTQKPLTFHISILAENTYDTQNQYGDDIRVNSGTEVYSKIINYTSNQFEYNITPGEITLENNQYYKMVVTVVMNSGLTTDASSIFTVEWSEETVEPSGVISIDNDIYTAYIKPFCIDYNNNLVKNTMLSVYRREFDGTFTLIADEIQNDGSVTVTDPHPSLDSARYRIVARNTNTSVCSYSDLPGIPFKDTGIIIQWDEKWTKFDYSGEDKISTPPWTGSMLKLPYNIKVAESFNLDRTLVEYIGRKSPVSYFGTQQGISMTLSTEFPKDDKETLYTLRRLATWDDIVYVREPSGNGYNANVNINMNADYDSLIIPVSIEVVRVEGDD